MKNKPTITISQYLASNFLLNQESSSIWVALQWYLYTPWFLSTEFKNTMKTSTWLVVTFIVLWLLGCLWVQNTLMIFISRTLTMPSWEESPLNSSTKWKSSSSTFSTSTAMSTISPSKATLSVLSSLRNSTFQTPTDVYSLTFLRHFVYSLNSLLSLIHKRCHFSLFFSVNPVPMPLLPLHTASNYASSDLNRQGTNYCWNLSKSIFISSILGLLIGFIYYTSPKKVNQDLNNSYNIRKPKCVGCCCCTRWILFPNNLSIDQLS